MRYRLRTLVIVVAIAPAIIWATTLWLAAVMESAGSRKYKTSGRGAYSPDEAAKDAKAAKLPDR